MLIKNRAYKNNGFKPFVLWFCHCLFLFMAMPLYAVPDPYYHSFNIFAVTRPAELEALGEPYEVDPEAEQARLAAFVDPDANTQPEEPVDLERQGGTDFEVTDDSTVQPEVEEVVNPLTDEITSVQIMAPVEETGGRELEATKKESPAQFFVEYDPDVIPVKDLPGLGGGAFNILCQNQKAWFKVDKDKALKYGVPESKILRVKGTEELIDMMPYQQMSPNYETEDFTDEAIQAYNREVCMTTTDVLRHVSIQFGHAGLKVSSKGFFLTSWLKSLEVSSPWHQYNRQKPAFMPDPVLSKSATLQERQAYEEQCKLYEEYEEQLACFEAWEQWYEDYRASRSKESLMLMFWPDWLESILTEEHPLFVEKGVWNESYHLTVKRRGVETIDLNARLNSTAIWQNTVLTSHRDFEPLKETDAVGMRPALMLPFHVLSGEVLTVSNDHTYTPFARPRYEPVNRKLTLHVYRTHYRPELDRDYDIKWADIPTIPAVVYDFYSDDDDSHARPVNRQPRLTYWVGEGGDFDGRLLGRRILYKTIGEKPIGCDVGSPVCRYQYPLYRGLEYRLVVAISKQPQKEREGSSIRQPDVTSGKEGESEQARTPPQVGATGATRHEKLNTWYSFFTRGKQATEVIQGVGDEAVAITRAFLTSEFYDFLASVAFSSIGLKFHSPIPKFPKILMVRMLQHLNLIH